MEPSQLSLVHGGGATMSRFRLLLHPVRSRLARLPRLAVAAIVLLAIVAAVLNLVGLPQSGTLDPKRILPEIGKAYQFALPQIPLFSSPGDAVAADTRSRLRLFEDDAELKPHTLHDVIRQDGGNTFSHWGDEIIFSSSDGSDPRTNGRRYHFERPLHLWNGLALLLVLMGIAAGWQPARSVIRAILPRGLRATTTRQAAAWYGGLFLIGFVAVALWISRDDVPQFAPALGAQQPLPARVKYYLQDPAPYSVIFLGDSQTYCSMHPEIIERYVPNMHGLNLSNFTNWFPTQFAMLREVVAKIPRDTIVVWSITASNFQDAGPLSIQRVYPVSFADALQLLWWAHGRPIGGLFDNLAYYHWGLNLPMTLQQMRARIDAAGARALGPAALRSAAPSAADQALAERIAALRAPALADPDVAWADVTTDAGQPTSLVRYFRRGGYYRTELDPAFFRRKQQEMAPSSWGDPALDPDLVRWKIFVRLLDLFSEHHVKLIVNVLRDAPFLYKDRAARDRSAPYMRDLVKPEVEKRGWTYVRLDDDLENDDYFDYNHLNSKGVAKYSPRIAAVIAKQMSR